MLLPRWEPKRFVTVPLVGKARLLLSAAGQVIPPTIIFDAKNLNNAWTGGELPGTTYGCSDSGWITTDLFESWLSNHFLHHAVSARPLLLLLDGHSTHYQPNVVQYAKKESCCCAFHLTQLMRLSHLIVQCFHHLRYSGAQFVTIFFKQIQVKS